MFFSVCVKNSLSAVKFTLGQCKLLGKCLVEKWQSGLQIVKELQKMCFLMHNESMCWRVLTTEHENIEAVEQ